jgi:hypothetical protein
MKRFFYAGCSFTHWLYPSWGDIIAYDKLNYKGYEFALNLAVPGGCNQLIASRLAWADKRYNITSQDDVAILWTTLFRESVLTSWEDLEYSQWRAHGNSFNSPLWSKVSNHEYIHNSFNMLDRNMTTFHYVSKLYDPFYQGTLEPNDSRSRHSFEDLISNDVVKPLRYSAHHDLLKKFHDEYYSLHRFTHPEFYSEEDILFSEIFANHPTILQHLAHAQKVTDLDSRTVEYCKNLHYDVLKVIADNLHMQSDLEKFRIYLINHDVLKGKYPNPTVMYN